MHILRQRTGLKKELPGVLLADGVLGLGLPLPLPGCCELGIAQGSLLSWAWALLIRLFGAVPGLGSLVVGWLLFGQEHLWFMGLFFRELFGELTNSDPLHIFINCRRK